MERVSRCVPSSQRLWVVQEYVVFWQFSHHQRHQAVRLDPHRRLLVDHQLQLREPHVSLGSMVAVDFVIHVICRILSSHHQRSARWDSIRQSDVQVGMTIMRYQIQSRFEQ